MLCKHRTYWNCVQVGSADVTETSKPPDVEVASLCSRHVALFDRPLITLSMKPVWYNLHYMFKLSFA